MAHQSANGHIAQGAITHVLVPMLEHAGEGHLVGTLDFDKAKLVQAAQDLRAHVETTFAVYLDAQRGWLAQEEELRRVKGANIRELGFSETQALAVMMTYGIKGNDGKEIVLHESSVAETLGRIGRGGANHAFLANMCAVSIYEFWEGRGRAQLAEAFFGKQDVITSDLFGELRVIRHCILHCRGIADGRVAKCKSLNWFKEGECIAFSGPRLHKIVNHIRRLAEAMQEVADDPTTGYKPSGVHFGPLDDQGNPICPYVP